MDILHCFIWEQFCHLRAWECMQTGMYCIDACREYRQITNLATVNAQCGYKSFLPLCLTLSADLRTTTSQGVWIHGSPSTCTGMSVLIRILMCPPWAILMAERRPDWIWPRCTTPVTPTSSNIPSQWFGFENWSSLSGPQGFAPEPQLMWNNDREIVISILNSISIVYAWSGSGSLINK